MKHIEAQRCTHAVSDGKYRQVNNETHLLCIAAPSRLISRGSRSLSSRSKRPLSFNARTPPAANKCIASFLEASHISVYVAREEHSPRA